MTTKRNIHAEQHAKATKRTPSHQYPDHTPVCVNGHAYRDFYDDIESAINGIVDWYVSEHGEMPPLGWKPDAYLHGITRTEMPFDADDWASILLEPSDLPFYLKDPRDLAERIIERYDEESYDGWEEGWGEVETIITKLAPALAYAETFGEFGDRAELARLLEPVGEIVNRWDLGFYEDSDHAIDLDPDHLALFLRD